MGNIEFMSEYNFNYAGRSYRIQHGDQYDTGIVKQRYVIRLVSVIQNIIERYFRINLSKWWTAKQIKKRKLKRIWDIVQWNNDADVFIMGHTHNPEVLIWLNKEENLKTYINCGDWVDNCTYVLIKDKQVRLRKWENKLNVEDI
jgi:UDP-2,3-diacylglucosamine pyrophosphatase LpxH